MNFDIHGFFETSLIHKVLRVMVLAGLATRVRVVAPVTFMMTQQRTRTICNPKLIATFVHLEKNLQGQSDCNNAS